MWCTTYRLHHLSLTLLNICEAKTNHHNTNFLHSPPGDAITLEEKSRLTELQQRQLAKAIRERLQVDDDDNVQDILDQHVSRVFSDLTPSKSPRGHSPAHGHRAARRRDRDDFSVVSSLRSAFSDSGNVYDMPPDGMVKSRSVPEYGDDRFSRSSTSRRLVVELFYDFCFG